MDAVTIGVDIGSSGVRAAEIHVGKDGRKTLTRFGQVGLPHGFVVDGEVVNVSGVARSLKRLWTETGFSSTDVVLGVSGPRVFVRQADVAAMAVEDLRSSLRFDAQDMIPIPMDDACFDFSLLDAPNSGDDGPVERTAGSAGAGSPHPTRRILLVAAHRELLRTYVATLREAGLTPKVMDPAPLALMRAVPVVPTGDRVGVEVIVSIGAELTTVAVREDGIPRFIRSLTVGGAKLTETIANDLHLELAVAERVKRDGPNLPASPPARRALSAEMRDLAEEVRATIEFFLAQGGTEDVERLLITGAAAQTHGLAQSIAGKFPAQILVIDPLAGLDVSQLDYDATDIARVRYSATTAVGLALWPTEAPLIRLSVLPEEVIEVQRNRRHKRFAVYALGGLAVVLGIGGGSEYLAAHHAEDRAHAAQVNQVALTAQVNRLTKETAVHNEVAEQAGVVSGVLQGDIDWFRVFGQLAAVMPPDISLQSFTGSRTNLQSSSTSSTSGATSNGVANVTFTLKGTGGLPAAAAWLQAVESDPDLSDPTIAGIAVQSNGGNVTFTTQAELTPVSESNRAEAVKQ